MGTVRKPNCYRRTVAGAQMKLASKACGSAAHTYEPVAPDAVTIIEPDPVVFDAQNY